MISITGTAAARCSGGDEVSTLTGSPTRCIMLLLIEPPIGNTRGPVYTESLLRTLHRANSRRDSLSLQLRTVDGEVGLAVECPDALRVLFEQELQDAYPGTTLRMLPSPPENSRLTVCAAELRLRPDVLPIRTWDAFLDEADRRRFADPVAGLLSAIRTGRSGRVVCGIQLSLRPATLRRQRAAARVPAILNRRFPSVWLRSWYVYGLNHPLWFQRVAAWFVGRCARAGAATDAVTSTKAAEPLLECRLLVTAHVWDNAVPIAMKKVNEICGAFGRFNHGEAVFIATRPRCRLPRASGRGFLLSAREVATLWHPLTESADSVPRLRRSPFREVEPPVVVTTGKGNAMDTVLGRVKFRQQHNQFSIGTDDLRRHLLAIGKTGCGKSTFLLNVVRQQIDAGRGVVLLDPHGQLVDDVLDHIPARRTNDVLLFDAGDATHPVGFRWLARRVPIPHW